MIKKILGLLVVVFSCIGFSSATFQTVGLARQQSSINSNYNLGFLRGGAIITDYLGTAKGIIAIDSNKIFWWYPDGRPYFYSPDWQGFFTYYDSCPEITYTGDNFVFNQAGCTRELLTGDYKTVFKNFFSKVNDNDFVYYTYTNSEGGNQCTVRSKSTIFCWSSHEIGRSICFDYANCFNGCSVGNIYCGNGIQNGGGFTDSLNYNNLTFGLIPFGDIGYAPGQAQYDNNGFVPGDGDTFGSGNTETIPSDVENYIRYFEDLYGREESMCYVGVGDSYLDVPYGSGGISFAEGRGATIFGLYYHLYNTFGDNAVYNVGSFINAWTNNLYNTYKSDPYYIQYNGPGDNTTVIYTGSFPFLNQPVAIYFMADNLNSYDNTENNGQGVVVYCDIKLNKENYENGSLDFSRIEEIIPDYIKNNVNNYTNTSVSGKDGYSTPDLGSGSIWGNLVQSGYNIPKDLNPTDLFSDFYGKINGLITNFNPAVRDGLIPLWIIYPMLFLILFRIMRH